MKIYSNGEMVEVSGSGGSSSEVYSTEEQRIGTWIDGKPLYRRVFLTTSPSAGNQDVPILTLDPTIELKRLDGMLVTSEDDASISPINFAHDAGASIACWAKQSSHVINMRIGVAVQASRPVELYLEYTKTTDTATKTLPAQSSATINLPNSSLNLNSIQTAPVTSSISDVEISVMEESN